MKYIVYILTYWAYAMNHACRMTYAYNKPNIRTAFGLTFVHLGILDALVYIAYGVGTFFRFYFFRQRFLAKQYLISVMCVSSFFSCIPFINIFARNQVENILYNDEGISWVHIVIVICLIGYGFSQLAIWQIILSLICKHWNVKKEGSYMGLWTTMTCIGNIMAFFVSNFMITNLGLKWENTMLLFAILNLFAALVLYFLLNQQQSLCQAYLDSVLSSENEIEPEITVKEWFQFIKEKLKATWDFRLFILTSMCQKILGYSFLFWYPTYLYIEGFQKVAGYVTLLFEIGSIFGSYILGKLMTYDKITCQIFGFDQSESNIFLKVMTVIFRLRNVFIMLFAVGMSFLFLQKFGSLSANIMITICLGLTIGGIFHVNPAFNSINLGGNVPRNVDMISSFSTGLATIFLGIFQLIIGIVVNEKIPPNSTEKQVKHMKSWSYRNFFKILILLMITSSILMCIRVVLSMVMECKKKKQQQAQTAKTASNAPITVQRQL